MLWQWRKGREGKQQLLVVMLLFVMTGLAIVVYLNQTPLQPRERDYAYAGSFYAFAIWIGLGVGMISEKVRVKSEKFTTAMAVLSAIACLLVPIQMASQTWDDHDRSGRYTCRDFGANYLNSMQREGHPIILTNGDNDTFPLWYNHEVEGVRTDTRVVNMEYLQTDWYIDQMKRQAYDSPPLPISLSHEDYKESRMEYVPIDTDSIAIGPATISLKGKKGPSDHLAEGQEGSLQERTDGARYAVASQLGTPRLYVHQHRFRHFALPPRPFSTRRTCLSHFSYGYHSEDRRGKAL